MSRTPAALIRQLFLDYFVKNGHAPVPSSSLIPANDPTLMFTNAGMVQFKDVFTGAEKRSYTRATTCQKCMRVSGKHNDLEEVGRTARHHTLFEMLGNFSFGDYFKEEAIALAWRFISEEMKIDRRRLWVTVFGGEAGLPADDEARRLWLSISGLPASRVVGKGMKDNFWSMGDTGPCGPCTEIHYDQGEGEPTAEDFENGRVVEIWNNVFMQFDRSADGKLTPLPKPSVDTGMGLERLVAVTQGVDSNYHTDLFLPLLDLISYRAGKAYRHSGSEDDVSMRVIADHARATAFLVADGLQPSNEGRGYVLRRIMRRAIRHGKRLGFDDLFFAEVCDCVIRNMDCSYPELSESRTLIRKVAETEEKSFRRTLDTGLRILGDEIDRAQDAGQRVLDGAAVFKLYDTYGFPKDLTEVIAREQGLGIDEQGFEREMTTQQERSRGSEVGGEAVAPIYKELKARLGAVEFVGYPHEDESLSERPGEWRLHAEQDGTRYLQTHTTVKALLQDGSEVDEAKSGAVEVVLDPTPFYGESGGQAGDRGLLMDGDVRLQVQETVKPVEGLTVSRCQVLAGKISRGAKVWAGYVPEIRKQTRAHHSATHLLHAALRRVLGDHVKQAGLLVDADHLRFDYSHFEAPSAEALKTVEADANARVQRDDPVRTDVLAFDEAKQRGAIALFGEKYGERVRMLTMGSSIELCGGTHARRTGDIGMILIVREEAVASGVRRIEAEVGEAARRRVHQVQAQLAEAAAMITGRQPPKAADDQPILLALAKAVRRDQELREQLAALGAEAAPAVSKAVEAPKLADGFGPVEARALLDLWQGMVQMANARGAEAQAITERLAAVDAGGMLRSWAALISATRDNERRLEQARGVALASTAGDLFDAVQEIGGVRVLATRVDGVDGKALRDLADRLRDSLGSGVLCLGGEADGKVTLLVAVTKDLTGRFQAGGLVRELAPLVGGRGGGKPELAQAGGNNPAGLEAVFAKLAELIAAGA